MRVSIRRVIGAGVPLVGLLIVLSGRGAGRPLGVGAVGGTADDLPLLNLSPAGQIGGAVDAVAVSGRWAYVGIGPRLAVYDVVDPRHPRPVGQSEPLPGRVRAIAVDGELTYLICFAVDRTGMTGSLCPDLWVMDVQDPDRPRVLSQINVRGLATHVTVSGPHAYVSTAEGAVVVLDLGSPDGPIEVASFDGGSPAAEVLVTGQRVYLAGGAGLHIFDVTDIRQVRLLGAIDLGPAMAVALVGPYAYVAGRMAELWVVDVTDPVQPRVAARLRTSAVVTDIAVAERTVYLAVPEGLRVLDVAGAERPRLLATFVMPGDGSRVALAGGLAFVTRGRAGLRVVDLARRGILPESQVNVPGGRALAVAADSRHAYVAAEDGGLWVLDREDPDRPRPVGALGAPGAKAITVTGQLAYLACGREGLRIVDVADPSQPREVGRFMTPDEATDVVVAGQHAYVAAGRSGLRIADISDPAHPRYVGHLDLPDDPQDLALAGHHLLVAARTAGLRLVDVTDPAAPREVGFYNAPDDAMGVAVIGTVAFITYQVVGFGGELRVLDISDPTRPRQVSETAIPVAYNVVAAGEGRVAVFGWEAVWLMDVQTLPASLWPRVMAAYHAPEGTSGVAMLDDRMIAADGSWGVTVLRLGPGTRLFLPLALDK
jgi:hypothetical protein